MFLPALMVAFSLVASLTASIAWFTSTTMVEKNNLLDGGTKGAYFAYGDGKSAGTAYGIKHPVHLYNLAWLQYLGFINDGTIGAGENKITYFELADDLDMTGWVIPPIGTEEDPFFGIVNGKNHTISNLTVSNNFTDYGTTHPTAVNSTGFTAPHIVGLFGVVGSYNNINNTEYTSNIYGTSANAIYAFNIDGATIKTGVADSLMGVVAGYVNGPITNVGVSASSLNTSGQATTNYTSGAKAFTNISDYSVVGYCEDAYKTKLNHSVSTLYEPKTVPAGEYVVQEQADEHGWGGSIPMSDLFNDLKRVEAVATPPTYPTRSVQNLNYDGEETSRTYSDYTSNTNMRNVEDKSRYAQQTTSNYWYATHQQRDTDNKITASYSMVPYNYERFACLSGEKTIYIDNALTTTKNYFRDTERFYITYSDAGTTHYLSLNGTTILDVSTTGNTPPANATAWCLDTNNRLYTFDANDHTYSQSTTYLSNNNNALTATQTIGQASVWTSNNSHTYFINNAYRISFNGTNWALTPNYVTISTTGGVYMVHDGTTFNSGTDRNFLYDGIGYYVLSGNNKYYLKYRNNNNPVTLYNANTYLYVPTTRNEFGEASNTYLQYSSGNTTYYIYYNRGWTRSTDYASRFNITLSQTLSCPAASSAKKYITEEITEDSSLDLVPTFFPLKQKTIDGQNYTSTYYVYYTYGGQNYYLTYNGTNNSAPGFTTDIEQATPINNLTNNGYIQVANTSTYLNYDNNGAYWSTSTSSRFVYNSYGTNSICYRVNTGSWYWPSYTYYYLYFNGSSFAVANNGDSQSNNYPFQKDEERTYEQIGTGVPADANTGYVVSGGNYWGDQMGDIRFGQFDKTKLQNDLNTVYTIEDDNGTSINITNSSLYRDETRRGVYEKSLSTMTTVYNSQTLVSGLHFMSATIGTQSATSIPYTSAEKAIINGSTFYNYQLPTDCIDFNLKEKGYINFIACSYFWNQTSGTNNSFFSLHEIQRTSNPSNLDNPTPIAHIDEIVAIYSDGEESHSYVYKYANSRDGGEYSVPFMFDDNGDKVTLTGGAYTPYSRMGSLYTGYSSTPVFKSDWIGVNTLTTSGSGNNMKGVPYYFDISMNAGEYALGSVPGGVGAYLIYLDIGANAEKVKRTAILDIIKLSEEMQAYPKGVGVIVAGGTSNDKNSYCINIGDSYQGKVNLSRSSDTQGTATQTPLSSNISLAYANGSITVTKDGTTPYPLQGIASQTLIERLTYIDYHPSNNTTTKVIVTRETINYGTPSATSTMHKYSYIMKKVNGVVTWEEKDYDLFYDDHYGNGSFEGRRVNNINDFDLDQYYLDADNKTVANSYNTYKTNALNNTKLEFTTNLYGADSAYSVLITFTPTCEEDTVGNSKVYILDGYAITISYVDNQGNVHAITGDTTIKVLDTDLTVYNKDGTTTKEITLEFTINSTAVSAVGQVITITITVPVTP